tara:strand:- start:3778 stop:3996 length:219 start_codon:yes stop_codon:yes gene_type:complete
MDSTKQIADQTLKGGLQGVICYFLWKSKLDRELIFMIIPITSTVLAWISTKIGDPELACLFIQDKNKKKKKK